MTRMAGIRSEPPTGFYDAPISDQLDIVLQKNILSFWLPRCLDEVHGGYHVNFNHYGGRNGRTSKGAVTQARLLWCFSSLAEARFDSGVLAAANHGYEFFMEHLWDHEHGGLYWELEADGGRVVRADKHLYAQAFGIYALTAFYAATHETAALQTAIEAFELLECNAHDPAYGGYTEHFTRDWKAAQAGSMGYLGAPAECKLVNTHLHLLEALLASFAVAPSPTLRKRIGELVEILGHVVVDPAYGANVDVHNGDWSVRREGEARVSYGHILESVSLLIEAAEAIGVLDEKLLRQCCRMFTYCADNGYDHIRGGFFDSGLIGQPAARHNKIYWVQAEALWSCLQLYRVTRKPEYLSMFENTWRFIVRYQIDWQHGEWHELVSGERPVRGDKGHIWKACYHSTRCLLKCRQILASFTSPPCNYDLITANPSLVHSR